MEVLIFDLGLNANGDKNGLYHIRQGKNVLKTGTHNQCANFLKRLEKEKETPLVQLSLFN